MRTTEGISVGSLHPPGSMCVHAHTQSDTCTYSNGRAHTCIHIGVHAHTHIAGYTHRYRRPCACMHRHMHTHSHTHTQIHAHTCAHRSTHAHTQTRAHTGMGGAHTHTHRCHHHGCCFCAVTVCAHGPSVPTADADSHVSWPSVPSQELSLDHWGMEHSNGPWQAPSCDWGLSLQRASVFFKRLPTQISTQGA